MDEPSEKIDKWLKSLTDIQNWKDEIESNQ